uniref:Cytochrome b561 n=1 Tax=Candidatus Kentrum sp. UNK TaxID=2126344 RepID=A0A451AVL3_9GAMM|nr:MAG: cytochrome b561 [Candidatus Kentron sp. UNK]VFK69937.1 MAG: cytochrome b561 [Candidatus Kentron sp. UNK]
MLKNTETHYGIIAKGFHWFLFLMLGFMIVAGNILEEMPKGAEKIEAAGVHKSLGLLVLLLVFLRLIWRFINVTPKDPEGTPAIQSLVAHAIHWALYGLMFAQPVAGILMSQAAGYPVNFFGLYELPTLLAKDQSLAGLFHTAHGVVWILLLAVVIVHAAGALYHHFIVKDDTLRRMGFGQ